MYLNSFGTNEYIFIYKYTNSHNFDFKNHVSHVFMSMYRRGAVTGINNSLNNYIFYGHSLKYIDSFFIA